MTRPRNYRAEYEARIARKPVDMTAREATGHHPKPVTATSYSEFLARKAKRATDVGVTIEPGDLHPSLFPHQAEAVRWAARRGRAAAFLDTGLGKTRVQVQWADLMRRDGQALIIAPLSVARQTIAEAAELGIDVRYVRNSNETDETGVYVTNYEMEHQFYVPRFTAVVLDESSILKNHTGAMRTQLIERWGRVPFRLACTATPAPNDITELSNHAEFLGAMSRVEMLAAFFVHDEDGWRMKGHAHEAMYRWMSTWAMAARRPSDITGNLVDDQPYVLPPLNIHAEIVETTTTPDGLLFPVSLGGVSDRARVRRETLDARLDRAAQLLDHDRPAIAWCGLNPEAEGLASMVSGAVDLHGSLSPERKAEIIEAFQAGEIRVLVTKPSVAGMGLNFQRAAQQVFVGLGDSYEQYYQAIRRSWRFGQTQPVDIHVVVSELESEIAANVRRKEVEASAMTERLVEALNTNERRSA